MQRLVNELADPTRRTDVAAGIAAEIGCQALLILIVDRDAGVLRPAPGFPQTLPGGPTWQAFLAQCRNKGEVAGEVAYPDQDGIVPARAFVADNGAVLLMIGGAPQIGPAELAGRCPFLLPLMNAEAEAAASKGVAAAAQDAERRETLLAQALDRSRRELAANSVELQKALDKTESLNARLRDLNTSLESRVAAEVAERMRIEESLRQAQKMEAIGQLTGGIAHDFNNLLQIVLGNLESLQRHLPEEPARLRRSVQNALTGARRAAVLTQRLLAFSRRQPLAPRPADPNRLVAGMSDLLGRTLGETIQLETVLAAGVWQIEVDLNQLEAAILNLAVNARDAMPDGGKLTIETSNAHLDRAYVANNAEVRTGQYVAICVSDTGTGMSEETITRAFEPFYTTKEVGKGTGLGLSMVYGFVKQSGGHIKVYSELGHGTTFRIYLPRLLGSRREEEIADSTELVPEGLATETILVVEDNDDVRAQTVEALRELGYRVLEAHDGPSALRLLERQRAVDLLFTDVVLPSGMTGPVLADHARKISPTISVLFTTGYARNAIVHQGRLDPGVQLLTKPFEFADLAAKVRDMLDSV
jgi:signal transduction histidine kinase/CheY-like chemotaxis protein